MITSKQIISLSETYSISKDIAGKFVTIYENPDYDDLKELSRKAIKSSDRRWDIRFVVDANSKKVYVWDAYLSTHNPVLQTLGYDRKTQEGENPSVLSGVGMLQNNRIVLSSSNGKLIFAYLEFAIDAIKDLPIDHKEHVYGNQLLTKFFKLDWSFVERYIPGFNNAVAWFKTECSKVLK